MREAPASSGGLPPYRLRLPWLERRASALICNGSVQNKIVRFGNIEPAYVTLAKRCILPLLVVLTLALCMRAGGQSLELARRIDQTQSGGKFCGFFDYRSSDRLTDARDQPVTGNCSARDFADFVRSNSIMRLYLAMPISTAPRIE